MAIKKAIQALENGGIIPGSPDDYVFDTYANVPEEDPSWFWPGVIPTSAITLLEGDPSAGKSTFVMNVLNSAIRGKPFPDGTVCPFENVEVIYQCTEVGRLGIISKILGNSGTPKEAVHFIRGKDLTLSDVRIQRGLREGNIRALIVDPMQQYFDGDMNNALSARRELAKLSDFAVENDAAVILIRHFGKEKQRAEMHNGLGSVDISAIARSILQIYCDDIHSPIRYLRPAKNSYAPLIDDFAFEIYDLGRINWIGPVAKEDKKLILDASRRESAPITAAAIIDLYELLKERDYAFNDLSRILMAKGHSSNAIRAAKDALHAKAVKRGRWFWSLPKDFVLELPEE